MYRKEKVAQTLREIISYHLAMFERYGNCFSVAMFCCDGLGQQTARSATSDHETVEASHGHNGRLKEFVLLTAETVREIDFIAYDQDNNLVVVMPQTEIAGACAAAERVIAEAHKRTGLRVSAGVATALDGETNSSILARASAAMRQACAAGGHCVWYHNGITAEPAAVPAAVG